jgi:hypothetical protein
MSLLLASSKQTAYQNPYDDAAYHVRGGMCRYVLLGFFKEFRDRFDKLAKRPMRLLLVGCIAWLTGLRGCPCACRNGICGR